MRELLYCSVSTRPLATLAGRSSGSGGACCASTACAFASGMSCAPGATCTPCAPSSAMAMASYCSSDDVVPATRSDGLTCLKPAATQTDVDCSVAAARERHALAGLPRGQPRRCAARTATPPTLNCRPPAPTSASQSGLLCRHSAGGTARPPALGWLGLPHGQSGLGTARRPACLAWVCHAGISAPGLLPQHSRAIVTAHRQTRCENGEFPTSSAAGGLSHLL